MPAALDKRFASLSRVLGVGPAPARDPEADEPVEPGYLVVRASGASAARLAIGGVPRTGSKADPDQIQLAMRASLEGNAVAQGDNRAF